MLETKQTDVPIAQSGVFPAPGESITNLATGTTYTIGERIGEGIHGVVFACKDVWQNDLAAKIFKRFAACEEVHARARGEFDKLVRLRNPYITFVYDGFEYEGTFCIIMERCYWQLRRLFQRGGFDGYLWMRPIARCLLQAVHYLHVNDVVHQDIHQGNLFATFAGDDIALGQPGGIPFKLGDFGVAKIVSEVNAQNTRASWLAPPEALEPTEFGPLDRRIDIYHVGRLLLQLAYSRELHFSREEVLDGKPRQMASALSPPYGVALGKALRRHAVSRTATAMELWRDLQATP
jgi:serine/threonine-protein kinase